MDFTTHAVFTLDSGSAGDKFLGYHPHDFEIYKHKLAVPGHGQYYEPDNTWDWRAKNGDPELYWTFNGRATLLMQDFQQRVIELNPNTTMKKLRVAFDWMRAWTNGLGKGFDTRGFFMVVASSLLERVAPASFDGYVPLYDWFNRRDLDSPYPFFDKNRVPGGFTMYGRNWTDPEGRKWFLPDYIPYDNIPPIEQIPDYLKFRAITCHKDKRTGEPKFFDFPQGNGYPLMIPYVARVQPQIPAHVVFKVDSIQDPMKINV